MNRRAFSINSLRVLQLSSSSQPSIRRITPGVSQTAVRFLLSCSSMFFTSAFACGKAEPACNAVFYLNPTTPNSQNLPFRPPSLKSRKSPALRGFVGGRPALATTSLYPRTKIERPKPGRNWPQRGGFPAGRGPGPPSA